MTSPNMNEITDQQLIDEFLNRFAVPNFFTKKHINALQEKEITDEQWEDFKDDYNHDSRVIWNTTIRFNEDFTDWLEARNESEDEESDDMTSLPSETETEESDDEECESDTESECEHVFSTDTNICVRCGEKENEEPNVIRNSAYGNIDMILN